MPSCIDVADFFLASQDVEAGDLISIPKLQKLCYYAQGFALALTGSPLFPEEIQAWSQGPVVPGLQERLGGHGTGAIPPPEREWADIRELFSREQLEILDEVRELYGQFSAWKLRDFIHEEAPWKRAFDASPESPGVISRESMRRFFRTQLAAS